MALSEHAARPLTGAESGNIAATSTGDVAVINPVEFGEMKQAIKQNTEGLAILTQTMKEFKIEFHQWRERFAFGKGAFMAVIVLAVFAGVGAKEGFALLAKLI